MCFPARGAIARAGWQPGNRTLCRAGAMPLAGDTAALEMIRGILAVI